MIYMNGRLVFYINKDYLFIKMIESMQFLSKKTLSRLGLVFNAK